MRQARESILFITPQPFFQWRGSPIRVRFGLQALSELGFHVDLLALPFGQDLEIPDVKIIRVSNPFSLNNIPIGPSPSKAAFDLFLLSKAHALITKNRYDFLHCIEDAGAMGILLRKVHGCPLIYEKHSEPASYSRGWFLKILMHIYGKVEAYVTRNADTVITGPDLIENDRAMAPHQRLHSIASIPSTLQEADDKQAGLIRKKLIKRECEFLITYVGSFASYQGIDLIFESMPGVLRDSPFARFIIIGGKEKEIAKRKRWLVAKKISDSVSFLGMIDPDQIPNYLAASDILLSPRVAGKNSSIKLLDYLKAGRPIVATDIPANRALLDESVSVFTQTTSKSFSAGITRLVKSENLRNRLSGNGKKIIAERHSFKAFKRCLKNCYDDLRLQQPNQTAKRIAV